METKKNNEPPEDGTTFQNLTKDYPGYAPDPQSGTTNDAFTNEETQDEDAAARFAAKGPVRNSNYHELDDKSHPGNYIKKDESPSHKTLED